ncbi:MAG: hypothetical protein ACE5KM_08815 [Planctomycetaceae bacterium]
MAILLLALTGVGCTAFQENGAFSGDDDGPTRWTSEWYEQEAARPEGARQLHSQGLMWPPYQRPTGKGQQWSHRFHSAHYWPHPYDCQDRAYLHAVSTAQVNNGWVQETTLFSHHFDEKNALNDAGRLHLKWIVQTAPEHRRYVWVQAADDKATSKARLSAAKSAAVELAGDGNAPPVALRIATVDGRPTNEINAVRQLEMSSQGAPRIPYTSPGGGGSASGGGGGGSTGGSY